MIKEAIQWATLQNHVDENMHDIVQPEKTDVEKVVELTFTIEGYGCITYDPHLGCWLYVDRVQLESVSGYDKLKKDIKVLEAVKCAMGWLEYFTYKEKSG